jgi:hypothetical protein
MVGSDEPATLARVRTLRTDLVEPLAATHGGRLLKTTGDGFLAAFASAVQALRCAIAIQEQLNAEPDGLRLRIGVHQGEVVAEGDDVPVAAAYRRGRWCRISDAVGLGTSRFAYALRLPRISLLSHPRIGGYCSDFVKANPAVQ